MQEDQDRKENYPYLHQRSHFPPAAAKRDAYAATSRTQLAAPFHFNARRMPIDWRLLHGIDVNRMVRQLGAQLQQLSQPTQQGLMYSNPAQHHLSDCALHDLSSQPGSSPALCCCTGSAHFAACAYLQCSIEYIVLQQADSCTAPNKAHQQFCHCRSRTQTWTCLRGWSALWLLATWTGRIPAT